MVTDEADVEGWGHVVVLYAMWRTFDFVLQAVGSQRMVNRAWEVTKRVILERPAW